MLPKWCLCKLLLAIMKLLLHNTNTLQSKNRQLVSLCTSISLKANTLGLGIPLPA